MQLDVWIKSTFCRAMYVYGFTINHTELNASWSWPTQTEYVYRLAHMKFKLTNISHCHTLGGLGRTPGSRVIFLWSSEMPNIILLLIYPSPSMNFRSFRLICGPQTQSTRFPKCRVIIIKIQTWFSQLLDVELEMFCWPEIANCPRNMSLFYLIAKSPNSMG